MNNNNNNLKHYSLQPLLFYAQKWVPYFYFKLGKEEAEFLNYWNTIYDLIIPFIDEKSARFGRKAYSLISIIGIRTAMIFFGTKNIKRTLAMINGKPNLQTILQLEKRIPSEAVVSRGSKRLEKLIDFNSIQDIIVREFHKNRVSQHIAIDSTPIEAREKPVKTERQTVLETKAKRKHSRKVNNRNNVKEFKKKQKCEEKMKKWRNFGNPVSYLNTLEQHCTVTGKKNSHGYMEWRIGYKVHLAVDDYGIPVSYAITGACVHDSKVAIPLIRMAKKRCNFHYVLADAGYDSIEIREAILRNNYIPLIGYKADRNGNKKRFDEAEAKRYEKRSVVERTNSELKNRYLLEKIYSRGEKAHFDIKLSVLMLTLKRMAAILKIENKQVAA